MAFRIRIQPNRDLPIFAQVIQQIRRAIAQGTLKAAEQIPTVRDLAKELVIFEPKTQPTKAALKKALSASGAAVGIFLGDVLSGRSKRRGFKKGVFTTLAYFIAHESHHRGRILLTLKVSGETLDRETQGAIWGWDQL